MDGVISKVDIENDYANVNLDYIIKKSKNIIVLNDIDTKKGTNNVSFQVLKEGLFMILETLDQPISVFKNGNLLCCNYLNEQLLGCNLKNVKNFNYKDFLDSSDAKRFNLIINNLHKYPCKEHINIKSKNDKNISAEINYTTQMINDDMYSVILVNDKSCENNKQNREAMTNLFHELKTPINVLLSAVQVTSFIIKRESFNNQERIEKYLKIMKQNCLRLIKLTNNIIDLTKIESGFYKVNLENYDIVDVVKSIVMSVTEYVNSKGISIDFFSDVDKKIIACDPDKIERVILNLISNSVKFTPKGGNIYVNIYHKKDKIAIAIKDTGIGIPKNKQKCIFNRYVQVQNALNMNKCGSGIGLYLVKNIIKNHGGSIYVNSEYTNGCEIIIEIPNEIKKINNLNKSQFTSVLDQNNDEKIDVEFSDIDM